MIKISSAIFKTFFLSLCIVANTHFAFAQTASILPPGYTQYLDSNGKPLSAGKVYNYIPSTTTLKTTWQDAAETIPNANPVILDAGGRAKILGDGSYRQIVKDRNNVTIWDAVTSSTGSGSSSPTATGDGDLVGTIKPWAGMIAPNQYAFTYGQEVSRTTYSSLYAAITSSQAAFCNSGSPTLNGLSDTTNFWIGMSVEVTCVAAGFSTIVSKTASSVTLAANANVTAGVTAIFYPWGRGNGTTTFNLPDLRGVVPAGNDIMGGVASGRLTTTYFGATNPQSSGALGGTQSYSMLRTDLPNVSITPTFTGTPTGTLTSNETNVIRSSGAVNASGTGAVSWGQSTITIPSVTPAGTISAIQLNGGVTQTPFGLVQPTRTTNFIIKITPDTNSATASGVTSLGGMTGDIACGAGLTCTGNTISETTPITVSAPVLPVVHPSSGNLHGTGCSTAHQIWWVDQNLCMNADVFHFTSNDPSAGFTLTLSGTITAGDIISLTIVMGSGLCSGVGCTVTTGALTGADNLGTASGKLACAIANNASLFRINGGTCSGGVITAASGQSYGGYDSGNPIGYVVIHGNGIAFDFNSAISMQVTSSVSGAATEVVTINNSNCAVRCSYALDGNPNIVLMRQPGIAPEPGSALSSIFQVGPTSDCPTGLCLNYGSITHYVGNSTAASLASAWLFTTTTASGSLGNGWYFGQGMFANIGCTSPLGSSGTGCVQDKGAGSINLPAIDYASDGGVWFNGSDKIFTSVGSGQFVFQAGGTNSSIISAAGGVGINASPTGNAFVSALGAFISGSQIPTANSNGIGFIGGATPTITARNYGTATALPLALAASYISNNEVAAPSSPAAGDGKIWYDSTDNRLHDKNSAGTIGTTVVADAGASNNFLTAISVSGAISKAQPTLGNLANINNNTIVGNQSGGSGPPLALTVPQVAAMFTRPTSQYLTSGTDATYTTPSNATWIEVEMIGGGGGGAGSAAGATNGGNGGNTCWKTSGTACTTPVYQATAGNGGQTGTFGAGGGVAGSSSCNFSMTGGNGGAATGSTNASGGGGGISRFGAAGAAGVEAGGGGSAKANSGSGGGGGGDNTTANSGGGGGAGGWCKFIIASPAATYVYTIGASGTAGAAGAPDGAAGGSGGTGAILVTEHYN